MILIAWSLPADEVAQYRLFLICLPPPSLTHSLARSLLPRPPPQHATLTLEEVGALAEAPRAIAHRVKREQRNVYRAVRPPPSLPPRLTQQGAVSARRQGGVGVEGLGRAEGEGGTTLASLPLGAAARAGRSVFRREDVRVRGRGGGAG